jgi:hypothetical protein
MCIDLVCLAVDTYCLRGPYDIFPLGAVMGTWKNLWQNVTQWNNQLVQEQRRRRCGGHRLSRGSRCSRGVMQRLCWRRGFLYVMVETAVGYLIV